ncbi:MAG TPA: hypothetical protein VIN03_23700 [Roseateles sp.]
MQRKPWTYAVAAALCLLSAGPAGAQQLERVEVAGRKAEVSKWFRAESQHFIVYSDAREEDVTPLLDNLEKLDHLLRFYTQPVVEAGPQQPKLTLYFHASPSGLREVADGMPADALGLYSSCSAGVQGFGVQLERIASLGDAQLEKSALNDTLTYVFEAYARHFLYRHTDIRTPAWFIDGFAQYFSSVRFSEQQMVLGRVPRDVAGYLRFLNDGRRYSLEWEDVLEQRLANTHGHGGEAGARLEFEAKSWLLTHYLLSSDEHRKPLSRYLGLVGEGASPTAAFERAFGIKTADLGRLMWRYGLRGMTVVRGVPQPLPAAQVSIRTLPRATGEFVLANAALKSCPGRQAGESLLKKVAALAARYPDDTLARLTLSRAQIDWGDPQQALPRLEAELRDDDANFEARYLAGMAHLRLAARSAGDARRTHLQAAQQQLQRARALDPQSPEAAFALFKAEVAASDTPDESALRGVISAWQAEREINGLAGSAALAYAYTGQADDAYRALGALALNVNDPATAQWAKQWRSRLETGVPRGDILAEMRRDTSPDLPVREWTVDKGRVLQKVELSAGLEAAQSFIKDQQQKSDQQPSSNPGGGSEKR